MESEKKQCRDVEESDVNSHVTLTVKEINEFIKLLTHLVTSEKKRVLLVCDIDDTLIRPVVNIGSEAWFNYSLKNEDIDDVINKLSMVYAVLSFQGVEKNTDVLIDTIKNLSDPLKCPNSMKYMCLTARNVRFHSYTTMHLHRTRYDKILVRRNMLDLPDTMYLMGSDKGNENVPLVRYIDNICSASGENKGEVLVEILNRYFDKHPHEEFDYIIFIDDSINNIDKVHCHLKKYIKRKISSICVHYTYMEEHKSNYSIHHFTDDNTKMNQPTRKPKHKCIKVFPRIETTSACSVDNNKKKIMVFIVDDQIINVKMIEMFCRKLSWMCRAFKNGKDVYDFIKQSRSDANLPMPDIIIMDYEMPIMDGICATDNIRKIDEYCKTHIHIVGSSTIEIDKIHNLWIEAGVNEYLPKPVNFETFQKIENHLSPDLRKNTNMSPTLIVRSPLSSSQQY